MQMSTLKGWHGGRLEEVQKEELRGLTPKGNVLCLSFTFTVRNMLQLYLLCPQRGAVYYATSAHRFVWRKQNSCTICSKVKYPDDVQLPVIFSSVTDHSTLQIGDLLN